jgi:hypothetical protein
MDWWKEGKKEAWQWSGRATRRTCFKAKRADRGCQEQEMVDSDDLKDTTIAQRLSVGVRDMGSHCHPRWEQPVTAMNLKEWSEERMKIKAKCNCWYSALPGMKGRSFQRQQGLTIGHART